LIRRLAIGILIISAVAAASEIVFCTGTVKGASPYLKDPGAVSSYQEYAYAIAAGKFVSETLFEPTEASIWSDPDYMESGAGYTISAVSGLSKGDIVEITESWYHRDSPESKWEFYGGVQPLWIQVAPYERNRDETTDAQLVYSYDDGERGFTLIDGTGQYTAFGKEPSKEELEKLRGSGFLLTRLVTVYRDASLLKPETSTRGYEYSAAGIEGGKLIFEDKFRSSFDVRPDALPEATPEPQTVSLCFAGLAGAGLFLRRRRSA
jgi:hypothetical protein